jgi:putative methyltransferase (TIGR04325 family)
VNLAGRIARRIVRGVTGGKSGVSRTEPDYIRFTGDYPSWEAACRECSGYDSEDIAERVLQTTLAVLRGEFAWERDSVGFREAGCSWPLLSCLLRCAALNGGTLRVIDFGGALGSVFFQHRKLLQGLSLLDWRIVEQPCFVVRGRSSVCCHPLARELTFHETLEQAMQAGVPDVLLLSSVLQYLQDPLQSLTEMLALGIPHVILDRTAVLRGAEPSLLSVQRVPASIYRASYPAWFLSEKQLMKICTGSYSLTAEWTNDDDYTTPRGLGGFIGFCTEHRGRSKQ